jgi:hypothetical protein
MYLRHEIFVICKLDELHISSTFCSETHVVVYTVSKVANLWAPQPNVGLGQTKLGTKALNFQQHP